MAQAAKDGNKIHKYNNRLSNRMTYLLIMTLAPLPIPSQISHTLFDQISFGVHAVYVMPRSV